jgi:hypothetical protein
VQSAVALSGSQHSTGPRITATGLRTEVSDASIDTDEGTMTQRLAGAGVQAAS